MTDSTGQVSLLRSVVPKGRI